jgi:4-amino-4-deoxy-L-arabinose transferase-like glycosyltransferase
MVSLKSSPKERQILQFAVTSIAVASILFLAIYNLTHYPLTWFDEGAHLRVPKSFARFGVYADYHSGGFRYYGPTAGPTAGVGPTVLLPIAAVFRLFGIGLLQARLVMVVYLLAAIAAFYWLARRLGGRRLAWVTVTLLIGSRAAMLIEHGRQVMGEVPALFFLAAGLAVWFSSWEESRWNRLALVGLLLGLAAITKSQFFLILAPALGLAWLANLVYYRAVPQRAFIVPGVVAVACYATWQVCLAVFLNPVASAGSSQTIGQTIASAAFAFDFVHTKENFQYLLSIEAYQGILPLVLVYGVYLALPRRREGLQWGTLLLLVLVNLVWYAFASVGWHRYAVPGMAFISFFLADFFCKATRGFHMEAAVLWQALRQRKQLAHGLVLRWVMLILLAMIVVRPLFHTVRRIVLPGLNSPMAMAAYMDQHVSQEAVIRTWEQEMGFLTDHNYHFPPPVVAPSPKPDYEFVQNQRPEYVLVGLSAHWIDLYPADLLEDYELVTHIGGEMPYGYQLYVLDD